jgi:hypothetical protein
VTVIGITGPTGAGKTTALEVLAELGFEIVDCDALYYWLLRNDGALRWRRPSDRCSCRTVSWTGVPWPGGSSVTRESWRSSTTSFFPLCPQQWNKKFRIVHKKDLLLMPSIW